MPGVDRSPRPAIEAQRRRRPRIASLLVAVALGVAGALTLSGCFMISLADGRSPFDDPFGASLSDAKAQEGALQKALDAVDTGGEWILTGGTYSGDCEGPCNIGLEVQITPTELALQHFTASGEPAPVAPSSRVTFVPVPASVLRATMLAAGKVGAEAKLDVTATPVCAEGSMPDGTGKSERPCAHLGDAILELTGLTKDEFSNDAFYVTGDDLKIRTRKNPGALDLLR